MPKNRSCRYLLPLIEGWSAKADPPVNCFALSEIPDSLICLYGTNATPHNSGVELRKGEKLKIVAHKYIVEYMPDVELILVGQYSRVSNECKSLILDRTSESDYESVEGILLKRDRRRIELNERLAMDISKYCDEYESKFGKEEVCPIKLLSEEMCNQR